MINTKFYCSSLDIILKYAQLAISIHHLICNDILLKCDFNIMRIKLWSQQKKWFRNILSPFHGQIFKQTKFFLHLIVRIINQLDSPHFWIFPLPWSPFSKLSFFRVHLFLRMVCLDVLGNFLTVSWWAVFCRFLCHQLQLLWSCNKSESFFKFIEKTGFTEDEIFLCFKGSDRK